MRNIAIFSTSDENIVRSILNCKNAKIKLIITNMPNSPIADIAKRYNVTYKCFDHKEYQDRVSHEKDIVRYLKKERIKLIIFAHYMRLVSKYFVDRYRNKILNIHPSLLPDFKGANGYKDAFEAGVRESGCTIHYVDEGLDTGEIICQKTVPRFENDNFDSFKCRVHDAECDAIRSVIEDSVV